MNTSTDCPIRGQSGCWPGSCRGRSSGLSGRSAIALRGRGVSNALIYVSLPSRELMVEANESVLSSMGVETHAFRPTKLAGRHGVRWGISQSLTLWLLRNAGRFDVVHVHGAWTFTTLAGLAAARFHRRVAVLSSHESLTDFDRSLSGPVGRVVKRVLRKAYLSAFDCIVVAQSLSSATAATPMVIEA